MDKIKQNKNYCSVDSFISRRNSRIWFENGKSIFAWALILLFVLTLFPSLVVSADTSGFTDQPLPVVGSDYSSASSALSSSASNGFVGLTFASGSARTSFGSYPSGDFSSDNVFLFHISSTSTFCACSDSGFYIIYQTYSSSNNGTGGSSSYAHQTTLNDTENNLYYLTFSLTTSNYVVNVPSYSSQADGLAAVRDFIDNGGGGVTTSTFRGVLPPNNALVIDLGTGDSTHDISMSATMPEGSELFYSQAWPQAPQRYGFVSSLPSTTNNIPGLTGNSIPWQKAGNTNIFGVTTSASASWSVTSDQRYLLIYNPMYWSTQGEVAAASYGGNVLCPSISVTVTNVLGAKVYSLRSDIVLDSGGGMITAYPGDDEGYTAVYDDSTDSWSYTDGDGNPVTLKPTGDNSWVDHSGNINSWLQNIANEISEFFNGAIGAVTTLVSAGSSFFQSLGGLYSWLPGPVYSVLISALIVAITIGVIKVFL